MPSQENQIIFTIRGVVTSHFMREASRGILFWRRRFIYPVAHIHLDHKEVDDANERFSHFPDEDSRKRTIGYTAEIPMKDFLEFPQNTFVSLEFAYTPVSRGFSLGRKMSITFTTAVKL